MGILRSDRVSGLGGANAIVGSTRFAGSGGGGSSKTVTFFKDSSIAPGTSDFCAEAWVYFNFVDNTNNTQLFANLNGNFGVSNTNCWALIRIGASNQFFGWSGTGWVSFGAGAPTVNTWHYIQLVRASNVQTLYFDGSALGSTVTNSYDLTHDEIGLGARDDGSEGLDGFISNFRLTIGSSAAALAGIVPSAASRVLSTDTKLLCCNDPGNVNNEDAQGIPTSTTSDNDVQMIQGFASRFVPDVGENYGTTFADGARFNTLSYMVPPGGTTAQRGRDRGVASQGYSPGDGASGAMTFFNISSGGITQRFGSLVTSSYTHTGGSSSTRGVIVGGYLAAAAPVFDVNTIEYVTIATQGNALNFGDRTVIGRSPTAVSSETRVCMAGGGSTYTNIIDFITTSTTGDATNFGDLGDPRTGFSNSMQSTTRGIFAGGYQAPSPFPAVNTLEYITMASAGDATNFGDMTSAGTNSYGGSMSSNTRGVTALGNSPGATNIINYVTIATTGDAVDFGDMTTTRKNSASCSSHTRGVIIGGETPTYVNTIEYIIIATTGNSLDFGDVGGGLSAASRNAAFSDCHGGLS